MEIKEEYQSAKIQRCRTCLKTGYALIAFQENYDSSQNVVQLLNHCASIQASLDDEFPQFICKQCYTFADISYKFRIQCEKAQYDLTKELKYKTSEDPGNSSEDFQPSDVLFSDGVIKDIKNDHTCRECGKYFKYRNNMLKHQRRHKVQHNKCNFCNETLQSPLLLSRHLEQHHAHLKAITCGECDKTFFRKTNLRLHMILHTGIKRYMCESCGMSFALSGNLSAHRRLHTGLKPYTCSDCGKEFTQQAALRSHEAGHLNSKDHVCAVCGAAFSRVGALRNHSKRHLSHKPFVCNLCNKAFTFSSERKRHMTIHTGERNYVCEICGNRFNRSTNLMVHRRIHTGEMPYVCIPCGKRFNQAHCLQTHLLSHK